MSTTIIGLVVLLAVGFMIFRPRRKASLHEGHEGQGEHAKDVSPHSGHGGRKTGGGCCG